MQSKPRTHRWLAASITLVIFALLLVGISLSPRPGNAGVPNGADAAAPPAGSWPVFGGTISRNMANLTERNIPGDFAVEKKTRDGKILEKAKNIKWVATLGSKAYGGPVIAGGRIFVGTNNEAPRDPTIKGDKGIIMCFDEATGKFLWQNVHDKLPSGPVNDWPREGICSTPVVEGDHLWYVSNRCTVVCAQTKDGKIVWELNMMKDLNVFPHNMAAGCPLIAGDTLFVVTANGVDENHINIPSPKAPSFLAINKKTGKVLWDSNLPTIKAAQIAEIQDQSLFEKSPIKQLMDKGEVIMHGQWSNPTYATVNGKSQIIFPGGNGWLYSFDPATGKLIWQFDANPKHYKYELGGRGTRSDFIATPVVIGDKCIIGTGQDPEHYEGVGHLWCIDITRTGDVSPELIVDEKTRKVQKNPNSAVVWHFGGPTTKEDQQKLQRDYYFGRTMSTVSVHDGLVYAAELAGYIHCLDFQTGKRHWVFDLKAAVWGSTYYVDGKVYVATEEGDVWVFPHGPNPPQPRRIEIGQPIRSTPVACNGVLYLMSESHLFAIAGN